jgi:hypothetical protein
MTIAISKDLVLINAAAFLRSFLAGLTGVVLGIYLFRVGLSSLNIGLVLGAGLAGAAAATVVVLMRGDLIGRRRALVFLSALSAIGGIVTDALVAYWFFRRFGVAEQNLGILFFVIRLLNAASHLGAAWLARRIGLVKTMVFTHLPSSLFLMAVPFAPSFKVAVALLLAREALVEMDVPTRQSYVAAVVQPTERTFASGATNLARNVFWAIGSSLAGLFMQNVSFSTPLVMGGGLKIGYDLLLYGSFRKLRPPEER